VSVPGLDATHVWNNAVTLQGDSDAVLTPPYNLIRKINGWRDLPDTEDSAETAQGRSGEIPRSTRRAGKTVAYECVCVGRTPLQMHSGMDALLAAFQDTDPEGEMVVSPFTASFGDSYFYRARPLALISDEEWIAGPSHTRSGGWERAFVLSLRRHDPHFYAVTGVSATSGLVPSVTPSGMPWAWTNNSAGYSAESVYVDVTDTGLANAAPVIDLYGPVTGPRVVNELGKVGLRFAPNLAIYAPNFLRLDFRRRMILYNGITDYDVFRVQEQSDWWDDGVPGLVRGATQRIRYGGKFTGNLSRPTVVVNFNPRRL
jgi:hypothetical protein